MRTQQYPATVEEARTLLRGIDEEPIVGTLDEIVAEALRRAEAAARTQGWKGPWEPLPPDCEYVQAHLVIARSRV